MCLCLMIYSMLAYFIICDTTVSCCVIHFDTITLLLSFIVTLQPLQNILGNKHNIGLHCFSFSLLLVIIIYYYLLLLLLLLLIIVVVIVIVIKCTSVLSCINHTLMNVASFFLTK